MMASHSSMTRQTVLTVRPWTAPLRLLHRLQHNKSILVVTVSERHIFAGTQAGEILVYALSTFERIRVVRGHRGSILGLCLSEDRRHLFSSAGDRIVNVWSTETFKHVYALYSTYDIGDIFCTAYSSTVRTIYLGAQNTSIQWYDLRQKDSRPRPRPESHPSHREDRFFDSPGPGGARTPRPKSPDQASRDAAGGQTLEIDKQHIHQFAHFGYVYCMLLVRGLAPDSPEQETLISGGGDGVIKLWSLDTANGGAIRVLGSLDDGREEGESVLSLAKDGGFLYSGRMGGELNVWDLETKQLVRNVNTDCGDLLTLAAGHGVILSAGVTGIVQKFNQHHEGTSDWTAHHGLILTSCLAELAGTLIYVTGGNDKTIALWEVPDALTELRRSSRTSNEQLLDTLEQFVSYQTVSSDPKYAGDCRRGAAYLKSIFNHFGAKTQMLRTEDHNPIVLAKFRGNPAITANRKRILLYAHYDVVPARNEQGQWHSDPFSMQRKDGFLLGRGVTDNKGPLLAAIYAIADLIQEQRLDSDITFLVEGEQECGSRGFEEAIKQNKDLVGDVDWILVANSYWLDDDVPCLTYGLRGLVHATIRVESQRPDLHSGVDGSTLLDEPLKDLLMLLARLNGPKGKVSLPGFYTPIRPVMAEEHNLYSDIVRVLLDGNPDLGHPEDVIAGLMARWRYPSMTVHGLETLGLDNSTVIPHMAKATLSFRLVPDQDANEIALSLSRYLREEFRQLTSQNHLSVTIDRQAQPWLGDFKNEMFKTLEAAITEVWDLTKERKQDIPNLDPTWPPKHSLQTHSQLHTSSMLHNDSPDRSQSSTVDAANEMRPRRPLYIREGGTIPSIRVLEKVFAAPAAQFPCGQASDGAHLDNERIRVLNLYKSREIFKRVFFELPKK